MNNRFHANDRQSSSLVLLVLVDFVITIFIAVGMFYILFDATKERISLNYILASLVVALVTLLCSISFGLYDSRRSIFSWNVMRRMAMTWFFVIASLALIAVVTKTSYSYSRIWFFSTLILSFTTSLIWRIFAHHYVKRETQLTAKEVDILAIGVEPYLSDVVETLLKNTSLQYRTVHKWNWTEGSYVSQLKDLEVSIKDANLNQVWIVGGELDNNAAGKLAKHFGECLARISYFPDLSFLPIPSSQVTIKAGLAEVALCVSPLKSLDCWLKNTVDYVFSILVLIILSPIYLILAIGVKLSSPGPILYRQQRLTKNGKVFEMLKFRTMPVEAEQKTGPVWAKAGENRATRFGSFLRKTSLDELPQFVNVIKGEMSVVGPRPERPFFVEKFQTSVPSYMQKHYVKAGITGLAQINGFRGSTSIETRIEHDLFYIQNWSAWLDFKIIIMTVFRGFFSKQAY